MSVKLQRLVAHLVSFCERRSPRPIRLALLATLPLACSAQAPPAPRLVVLYSTCTVNKHYLSPYNEQIAFTPGFARFGREAAVFTSHQTESGVSGTAFASIYAGVQADHHGVFKHPRKLGDDLYLIFEAYADAGYDPFYWSAHMMTQPQLNYSQGVPAENIVNRPLTGDDERLREVLDRLRRDENYRALVVTSFSVTHGPWDLENMDEFLRLYPAEGEGLSRDDIERYHQLFEKNYIPLQTRFPQTVRRLKLTEREITRLADVLDLVYRSRIHVLDTYFGSLLSALEEAGVDDVSLVAFTVDHGQTLYREGRRFNWTHAPDLDPEVIDVPLMIRGPRGLVPPRQIDAVTRSIDVYPTLAGLSGIGLPPEAGIQGVDLSRPLRGREGFPDIRGHSHGTLRHWKFFRPDVIENIWASMRVGNLLYTWRRAGPKWSFDMRDAGRGSPAVELLPTDPEHEAAARELWKYREHMIAAYHRQQQEPALSKGAELQRLKEDEANALRSLGYIE